MKQTAKRRSHDDRPIIKQKNSLWVMPHANWLWLLFILSAEAFNLYKSLHPFNKATHLFDRLRHHELITFEHNQFHHIDDVQIPIYPMNGKLEFYAFGRYYKLLIRKNVELFSDNFVIERHKLDNITKKIHKTKSFEVPQCHYTAEYVIYCNLSSCINLQINNKKTE